MSDKDDNVKPCWIDYLSFDQNRVISIEVTEDKKNVRLTEACDMYFSEMLSKKQFTELIDELIALRDSMIDA